MEKLTIEQKAKRYNEAIKIAKSKIKNDKDHVLYKEDIIEIFPELKQSEDEIISEEIITYLSTIDDKELIPYKNWIAWLMKKSKNKVLEENTFVNIDEVRNYFVQEVYRVLDVDPTNDRANQIIDAFDNLPILEFEKYSTVEWNEEDATRLQRIIDFLWHNRKGDTDTIYQQEQDINWLKSIKNKMQSKQNNKLQGKTTFKAIKEEKVDNANKVYEILTKKNN